MIVNEHENKATGDFYVEALDLEAGTRTVTINGEVWESRPLTADELAALAPAPDARADLAARAAKATTVAALRTVLLDALEVLGG